MKKLVIFLAAVAVLIFVLYWPARHHVVLTEKGIILLNKRFVTYADTYVDVRAWSSDDFDAHPELKRAMIGQGYRDMLIELRTRETRTAFDRSIDKAQAAAEEIAERIHELVEGWVADPDETRAGHTNVPSVRRSP